MNDRERRRILIYDIDAGNPYGRELAALLNATNVVKVLVAQNTQWLPATITTHRILPSTGPSFLLAQIFWQLRGLAAVAWAAFIGNATIIVVMTRGWYDELALALAAVLGARVIAFAHDPIPKWQIPRIRHFSRRMLFKYATVLLAHSETLAAQANVVAGRSTKVVPHLPFVEYAAWARAAAPDRKKLPARSRLLLLGRMAPDKGLDRLPAIFELIPETKRKRISLAFAGPGKCDEVIAKLTPLVDISRIPLGPQLSDIEIIQELAKSDVLLAPYQVATASSTVVLALCSGLKVVAYDIGALADVVAADGLVSHGDEAGFAKRICETIETHCGGPLRSIDAWRQASLEAWLDALGDSYLKTAHASGRLG